MKTKEQIKEQIIELNYEILTYFDDKVKVRLTRDKINVLLVVGTIVLAGGLFFVDNFLCGVLLVVCALMLLTAFVDRINKK